jgi:hypothetical protein
MLPLLMQLLNDESATPFSVACNWVKNNAVIWRGDPDVPESGWLEHDYSDAANYQESGDE